MRGNLRVRVIYLSKVERGIVPDPFRTDPNGTKGFDLVFQCSSVQFIAASISSFCRSEQNNNQHEHSAKLDFK